VLEHLSCAERLRDRGLFSLGQRWLQWSLTVDPRTCEGMESRMTELGSSQQSIVGGQEKMGRS